jgi:DNA repair protein RAD57
MDSTQESSEAYKENEPVTSGENSVSKLHREGPNSTANAMPLPNDPQAQTIPLPTSNATSYVKPTTQDALALDHQQRWFTGWGDDWDLLKLDESTPRLNQKTPSLGLVWTAQIACRLALIKLPEYTWKDGQDQTPVSEASDKQGKAKSRWRRFFKVVFATWAPPTGPGIIGAPEVEILTGGVTVVKGRDQGPTSSRDV